MWKSCPSGSRSDRQLPACVVRCGFSLEVITLKQGIMSCLQMVTPRKETLEMGRITLFLCCAFICMASVYAIAAEKNVFRATIGDDGVQKVEIVGGSYFFKPDHVIVKVNVPVELVIRKEGGIVPHDIVIDAPGSGIKVRENLGSDPKIIRFTPTKVGKYPFYCDKKLLFFASHREKGMEGLLEVVE